jgi:hypothetical protein
MKRYTAVIEKCMLMVLWFAIVTAIFCGCTSAQKPEGAEATAQRGCRGCVLLEVKFIDCANDEYLRELGVEFPQPDDADTKP